MFEYLFYGSIVFIILLFLLASWTLGRDAIIDLFQLKRKKKFIRGEPRIVCAAARNKTGKIIVSPRHSDTVYWNTAKMINKDYIGWQGIDIEQGFIDQFGNFLTREEAWVIAEKNGQIIARVGGDGKKLFSENLY